MLVAILAFSFITKAQPFNNEWINFSNTYYKFKVGKDGLYRIPESTLRASGLENTPAEHFRLYRNGVEVPLYTSAASGPLPAGGYIEFWGRANDGEPDRVLYRNARFQHSTRYNLHADTAIYFLTVEPVSPNLRFASVDNDVAGNTLAAEPYFLHTVGTHFKQQINPGFAADLEQYIYSSSYDRGEFWSSTDIRQRVTRTENLSNLKPVVTGPNAVLRFGAFGNTVKTRRISAAVNGNMLKDTVMNFFNDLVSSVSFSTNLLSSGSAAVAFTNVQPPAPPSGPDPYLDRLVLSFYEIIYPREFDFGGANQFYFELEARTAGYYLEIKNFNAGGSIPVLYDTQTLERYVANTQVAGVFRFSLKGSATARKMVLVSQAAAVPLPVTTLIQRKFTDFRNTAEQGDYLIISNPLLYNGANGNNPVEDYRAYRSSVAGGSHSAKLYDINELVDQFAFGIKGHPLSVKNFLRFARANFSSEVKNIFLIGKGVSYNAFRANPTTERPLLNQLNLVPTYGYPGSDNLLSSTGPESSLALTGIGRLSAVSPTEVEDYLEKVKEYEQVQQTISGKTEDKLWMKNIVHVMGATDALLGVQLCSYLNTYKNLINDTLVGANTTVLCKSVGDETDQSGAQIIREKFEEGISLLTYFGHSSASTLQFSIEDPVDYNNKGKYPVFSVNGCYAGDFFQYAPSRFQVVESLTEKFVLAKQKGGIAFLASTHFGVVNYLSTYLNAFYTKMGKSDYGATLGRLNIDALTQMTSSYSPLDFLAKANAEQLNLHGDPALKMNFQPKPDYVVEESMVEISPNFISISDQSFKVKVRYFNMGKAINDSIHVEIKRINPDGSVNILYNQKRPAVNYADSLEFDLPVVATLHKGQSRLSVVLDGADEIDEMVQDNNSVSKSFFIYEDEATPAYPYNYAIVSDPAQKLYASTANPFSNLKQYVMEIDTTALFNSSLKRTVNISSVGGLLEFDPQTSFLDSVVYYWRTALVPGEGGDFIWNQSSFMFRSENQSGFNQSHFFQHRESEFNSLVLDEQRQWVFGKKANSLVLRQAMYPTSGTEDSDFSVLINDDDFIRSACVGRSLVFHVIDPRTFKPWLNVDENGNNLYRFGSGSANCKASTNWNFEFSYMTPESRKLIMDFMDSIPPSYYVVIRSNDYNNPRSYSSTWRADTSLYGSNNSLYHKLLEAGLTIIDDINAPKSWGLIYRKNDPDFTALGKVSVGLYDRFFISATCTTPDSVGYLKSPEFGPSKKWKELRWEGHPVESNSPDKVKIEILGIRKDRSTHVLKEVGINETVVDVSDIDAAIYPKLKLNMRNADSVNFSPYQLDYWRLIYDPVPEGAITPNLFFTTKDTVGLGEIVEFGIAFKNITSIPFDSLKIKVILTDANNVPHELPVGLLKPLGGGDTVRFTYKIDTRNFPGLNTLYIDFNPDDHQPEQYHFNNFLFRNLYVDDDRKNPLLDVTFDGVHILNGDIVSARPRIQIKLKDESKYLLLNDTSLMRVQVRYPDGSIKTYRFDNDTVRFIPAVSASDNTATIEFSPAFLNTFDEENGIDNYELIVTGKDASNNPAGKISYSVEFTVINKPMISNLLNYPNPFSTSTAFVFTLTGSEIPTNFKIQILTVTGKIVREITGDELGPIRIGRNITEFKWDGTDQFGQRLANGVYLYRVISMLNGKKLEKYKANGDTTDKFFTKGYGKMYLIR
ncbi:C25 family cysteine peptidase [Flavihumibacter stibioxidans]|uniref:Gingipain domain-containing protein n=1 Tax=Flavihumibacter stibioxidans TaxID=1834163 RepID=A0ABR7M5D8_9BACT|nr:C25 family cysteine peptidase [Flavihumibacter stibioxidans]MBC6490187.1 hypothetical protein [Flavihumibacter stibioxidans]